MNLCLNNPLISVVMAVKNCSDYIVRAIEGILHQDLDIKYEVIIGDDFSNDDTLKKIHEYLDEFTKKNIDIYLYSGEKSIGCGLRRNCLINVAHSDIIAVADGDDFCLENRLSEQYKYFKNDINLFALSGSCNIISKSGIDLGKIARNDMESEEIYQALRSTYENPISDPCAMFRKNIFDQLGGYSDDPFVKYIPDLDLWMRFYEHKNMNIFYDYKIKVSNSTWVNYRQNPEGNTMKFSREMMKAHGMRRHIFNKRIAEKTFGKLLKRVECPDKMELIYEKRN